MIFECIAESLDCVIGERYVGRIRNKFAIDIKDRSGKVRTHDIEKFRIVGDINDGPVK